MVTSGLFQIKGSVKVKESVLEPSYFKPKSYWENGEIVYNREGKGYISFGNKYLSYRFYPNDEATHVPYEDIRKIEFEDEIESISDPKFLRRLEPNQHSWVRGSIGIKSTLTIKKFSYDQNSDKAEEEKVSDIYLKFSYEYLTVIKLNEYSKDNISLSESKVRYDKIRSIEFEDRILDLNGIEIAKNQIKIKKAKLEREKLTKEMEKRYPPKRDSKEKYPTLVDKYRF